MAPEGHLTPRTHITAVRRVAAVGRVMVLAFVLAACSPPPAVETVPEPETVETCDGLVDVGAQLVRAYVRVLDELRVDALLADELPPEFVELERIGSDLDSRVTGLGCDAAALNTEIAAEVADLETENPAAQVVLDIVDSGLVAATTVPPATTSPGTTPPDPGETPTDDVTGVEDDAGTEDLVGEPPGTTLPG